jgi:hypothetical protein
VSGRFPDFLGIGAQKAGTTWLYENLRQHPELFLSEEKELHFFDQPGRWRLRWGLRRYRSHFAAAGDRICGEITPSYGFLPTDHIRIIHQQSPDLRLLLLLRDPIARAWSGAVMRLTGFRGRDPASIPEAEYREYLLSDHSIDRTRYSVMIDRWTSFYSLDQVFVGFYEDLQGRPWSLLQEVFRHLGVSSDVDRERFPFRRVVIPVAPEKEGVTRISVLDDETPEADPVPAFARELLEDLYREEIRELRSRFTSRCDSW